MQISDPDDSILVDEKIVVEDAKKVKQIPLTITSHGVHEMCLKLRGTEDVILFSQNLDFFIARLESPFFISSFSIFSLLCINFKVIPQLR